MDPVAQVGIWLAGAVAAAALVVAFYFALHGLAWCSLRSLWRLNGVRYVAERIILSERIQCDGEHLTYSPRAYVSPPRLFVSVNTAGWPPGLLTPEACTPMVKQEIVKRSLVLGAVALAIGGAWVALFALDPGAAGSFVSLFEGAGALPTGLAFAALAAFSAFVLVYTIWPFALPKLPRFASLPQRTAAAAKDKPGALVDFGSPAQAPMDAAVEGGQKQHAPSHVPDDFLGSQETLNDLLRFAPLQRRVLGGQHEAVFVSSYCRSLTLFHMKRYDDSLADLASYAETQRRVLGKSNYWALKVQYLKAVNLAFLRKWSASLETLNELAPLQTRALGAIHPDTLMTRSARVTAWAMLERYADVAKELDKLLPECERVLGPDDHFTASNVRLKGIALQKLESAPQEPAAEPELEPAEVSAQLPAQARSSDFRTRLMGLAKRRTPFAKQERVQTGQVEVSREPPVSAEPPGMMAFQRLEPDVPEEAGEPQSMEAPPEQPAHAESFVIREYEEEIAFHQPEPDPLEEAAEAEPLLTAPEPPPAPPPRDVRTRLKAFAVRKPDLAPKQGAKPMSAPKQGARETDLVEFSPRRSLPPIYSDVRRANDSARDYKRLAVLAGAVSLGVLVIGGGVIAATSALREASRPNAPPTLAETAAPAIDAAPDLTPLEQPVSEPAILEDTSEPAPQTLETTLGLNIEQYATSMLAGRHGAKVREAPSRDAPQIEYIRAGSDLRITGRIEAAGHQWYRVALPNRRSGFVREDVVVRDPLAIEDYTPSSPMRTGRTGANVRAAARVDAPLVARLQSRSDLNITGRTRAAGHTWYRIALPDGREGFVREDVVQRRP